MGGGGGEGSPGRRGSWLGQLRAQASKQAGKCGAGAHLEARACPGCPVESTNRRKEVGPKVQGVGSGPHPAHRREQPRACERAASPRRRPCLNGPFFKKVATSGSVLVVFFSV